MNDHDHPPPVLPLIRILLNGNAGHKKKLIVPFLFARLADVFLSCNLILWNTDNILRAHGNKNLHECGCVCGQRAHEIPVSQYHVFMQHLNNAFEHAISKQK